MKSERTVRCRYDGFEHSRRDPCPACALYNAAVTAINAAAQEIATNYDRRAKNAWLNEYGVFADIDGIKMQVGTVEEAGPFVALTGATRKVRNFYRKPPITRPRRVSANATPTASKGEK